MTDRPDSTRRDLLTLGALGAGAALGSALMTPSVAQAQVNGGLKVGLVDIGVVFKQYVRKDDLEKEINARKQDYEKQAAEQQKTLEGLRMSLQNYKEGSDMWRQKRKDMNLQVSQMKVIRDGWEEDLKIQIENLTLMILNEIEDRVRKFGTDNKFDLIVKIDTQGWGDERFQERIFRAQVSSVLYHRKELDVTPDVLRLLNDKTWLEEKQKGAFIKPNQNVQPPTPQPPK
jgi:Skp family chaperone for outer membrane proteins